MECLYTSLDTDQIKLAGLPNIVEMVAVFADQVHGLPGDVQLYGDALLARLNPRVGVASWLPGLQCYYLCTGVWQEPVTLLGDEEV